MTKILRTLFVLMAMMVSTAIFAEDYTLKEGENVLTGYTSANGTFVVQFDGNVLIEAQEVFNVAINGTKVEHSYVPGKGYAYSYEIKNVKAQDVITVSSDFIWSSTTMIKITIFADVIPVQVLAVYPSQKEPFSWTSAGMVTINFNKVVTCKSIKLVAGEHSTDVDDVHIGNSIGFNLTNALNSFLSEGYIKAKDKFQVKITGLGDAADKNNLYNGDGELLLDFIAPFPQHNLLSTTVAGNQISYTTANTYEFLSYFPTDGEDGLFVLEFDENVKSVSDITLRMGNIDLDASGKFHRSSLPYTIEGNKIFIDARGKLRTLATLFPALVNDSEEDAGEGGMLGAFDTSVLTITVSNVIDINGNAFRSENQGSVGSYSYVLPYKEIIDEAYIDGDNKSEGEDVKAGETISLWLSNPDIKFDGIEVSYFVLDAETAGTESETMTQHKLIVSDFTITPDPLEGEVITFVMPEMPDVVEGSTVRVALGNANSTDGMPHYLYIEFKANSAVVDCIKSIASDEKMNGTYGINGVKVNEADMHNGLFIVKGKKVLVK